MFKIVIENLLALRHFQWTPAEVSVLVGPNGAGKSTLLLALRFLRMAVKGELNEAASYVLGGSFGLRNFFASSDEPISFGIDLDDISWRLRLIPKPPTIEIVKETLTSGGEVIYNRSSVGQTTYKGQSFPVDNRLGLRFLTEITQPDAEASRIKNVIQNFRFLMDLDLPGLREEGSRNKDYLEMLKNGRNAFALLRYWHERRELAARYQFVRNSLAATFKGSFEEFDFDSTSGTVTLRFFHPGMESPILASHECNGILAMLVELCAIADTPPGGLVCIDEPENSLHPFAIRQLVECASTWARRNNITVVFATHSPVLLDKMDGTPERVFVLNPKTERTQPESLDKLKNLNWLSRFKLGDVYADGEYGYDERPAVSVSSVREGPPRMEKPKKTKRKKSRKRNP